MRRHSAHVDANVLAELNAGLISGKRATRIHAHLAGCQHCARLSAGLTEISALLAAVPVPAMPESVTRRLNAALAQEVAERPARTAATTRTAPATSPSSSARVLSFRSAVAKDRSRGLPGPVAARAFAAVAAACVVAVGGYAAAEFASGSATPSSPGPGQAGPRVNAPVSSGPAALPFLGRPPAVGSIGTSILSFKVINSGVDYQSATLSTQIKAELGQAVTAGPAQSSGAKILHAPSTQQYGCVMDVTGDIEPALVDSARYNGRPATVIALAHVGNQVSQAWVVGSACSADDTDILAHVTLPASGG